VELIEQKFARVRESADHQIQFLLLFQRLRTLALGGTELATATAGTIRQRFLKIGALVTVSTRRVYVRLASAFPLQKLFAQAHRALAVLAPEEG
jgi:Transposase DDE domain group 1